MKRTLRGLGIGLFLAGATYTALDYFETPTTPETATQYKQVIQDLEEKLKTANEHISVLEKAEPVKDAPLDEDTTVPVEETTKEIPAIKEDTEEKASAPEPEAKDGVEKQDEAVVNGSIYIYEGVSLYDIGKQAEDAGLIQSSRELELFLAKPEYAKSIQKGQFDLHSEMTIEEMARVLTGKKVGN